MSPEGSQYLRQVPHMSGSHVSRSASDAIPNLLDLSRLRTNDLVICSCKPRVMNQKDKKNCRCGLS